MTKLRKLHIISFDNPFPPNYGGAIDVFYKLKALHDLGIEITLHAFTYGRSPHTELTKYCKQVYYYPRKKVTNFFDGLPYIVSTRNHPDLIKHLLLDTSPILFEGLHTCYLLDYPALIERKKFVRMHNIEHDYYRQLAKVESSFIKRAYFIWESIRLEKFTNKLSNAQCILAISRNDFDTLNKKFVKTEMLGPFHPNEEVTSITGRGDYACYHGNLAVGENDEAAKFLVSKVFAEMDMPFVIAGNKPSNSLKKMVARHKHIQLIENVSTKEIDQLITHAHVNVIPTFQPTGIKLKLINVLYKGRFVLANHAMIDGTGCEDLCHQANTAEEFVSQLNQINRLDFEIQDLEKRISILEKLFSNKTQAQNLVKLLFD